MVQKMDVRELTTWNECVVLSAKIQTKLEDQRRRLRQWVVLVTLGKCEQSRHVYQT